MKIRTVCMHDESVTRKSVMTLEGVGILYTTSFDLHVTTLYRR